MSEHVTRNDLEDLGANRLGRDEVIRIDDHLASCDTCRAWSLAALEREVVQRFDQAVSLTDHLSYAQLEGYVDGRLAAAERSSVLDHIESCDDCSYELRDLSSLRDSMVEAQTSSSGWLAYFKATFARPLPLTFAAVMIAIAGSLWFVSLKSSSDAVDDGGGVAVVETHAPTDQVVPEGRPELIPQRPEAPPEDTTDLLINDGGESVGIGRTGELKGYDSAPSNYRNLVKRVLTSGKLALPDLRDLDPPSRVLMGDGANKSRSFRIHSPAGKVLLTNTPTLSWKALGEADHYIVEVFDQNFNKVASSRELKTTSWKTQLPRGKTFSWQVAASVGDVVKTAPQRPEPEARFRILDQQTADRLARLRRSSPRSHLLLGTAFAEAGLIDEAILELERVTRENPNSRVATKLLRQLRSVR